MSEHSTPGSRSQVDEHHERFPQPSGWMVAVSFFVGVFLVFVSVPWLANSPGYYHSPVLHHVIAVVVGLGAGAFSMGLFGSLYTRMAVGGHWVVSAAGPFGVFVFVYATWPSQADEFRLRESLRCSISGGVYEEISSLRAELRKSPMPDCLSEPDCHRQRALAVQRLYDLQLGRGDHCAASSSRRPDMSNLDLRALDLRGMIFRFADFTGTKFDGASMAGNNLYRSSFHGASAVDVDFQSVIADHADFSAANLSGANLVDARCLHAKFDETTLKRTNLALTNVTGAEVSKALRLNRKQLQQSCGTPVGSLWGAPAHPDCSAAKSALVRSLSQCP